ncbi:MAG: hypoxanthine phosphoribosyltransferase [bacterium]|nr:hypoxanthine phosphoribosyltransferase [bacterium]
MTQLPRAILTEREIGQQVRHLADRISRDYREVDELFMIGVLRGAFIFLADLSRLLKIPRRIDFIALSSYEDGDHRGAVRLIMDLRSDLAGRHVLIVEDIVDTGHTLAYLMETLAARRPASLKSCVLVRKPSRHEVPVEIDYLGFEIADVWVVGYGLDYNDRYRTLPYIGALDGGG